MTFLNPVALFGLLAAAIPILLHLLNLRKLKTIEFSTLTFLKELQRTKIRRLKLRQLLLLILRTLLVVTLALAFARPTLKGSLTGSLGSHARTSAVVIVDDSYSMSLTDENGDLLKQAKTAAVATVGMLREGDEAALLRLSEVARDEQNLRPSLARDHALLARAIEEIQASAVFRSADDALRYAAGLLSASSNPNKEVYLLSDFQSGLFRTPSAKPAQEKLFGPEVRVFLVVVGRFSVQNLGIESVSIPTSIFEQNKPFTVRATILNSSVQGVRDHVVSVFLNGTRISQRGVDLQGGASTDVSFPVVPSSTGFVEGFIELEDDDFEADNRRFFVVHIPERVRVLLIGRPTDTRYIRLSLATRFSTSGSAMELVEASPHQLGTAQMEKADALIIVGGQDLSMTQVSQIRSFAKNGGGLLLFPDATWTHTPLQSSLTSALGLPAVSSIEKGTSSLTDAQSASFVEFDKVDLRHPLFEGMFEGQESRSPGPPASASRRSLESPRVHTSVRYALGPQSSPVITLSNGSAFLVEQTLDAGKTLLFAVVPTTEWSDFPRKGLFVPLIHRAVLYVSRQHKQPEEIIAGNEVLVKSLSRTPTPWTVRDPGNLDRTLTPSSSGWQQVLRFQHTDRLGFYSVWAQNSQILRFGVNLDPRESELTKASSDEVEAALNRLGIDRSAIRFTEGPQDLERTVQQTRFGVELWRSMLVLALALGLTELMVARTGRKETLERP